MVCAHELVLQMKRLFDRIIHRNGIILRGVLIHVVPYFSRNRCRYANLAKKYGPWIEINYPQPVWPL